MGEFLGPVESEWLQHSGKDRKMKLLKDLIFIDSDKRVWIAERGSIVDGASIPRALWVFAGSPFSGDYRRASVIHDTECQKKTSQQREVHKVFYEMMREDGVPKWKAWVMYKSVVVYNRIKNRKWK